MRNTPLVSVVMPAYNPGPHLQAAVASVLAQTLTELELIVIDDGSTDGSVQALATVQDERLRVVTHTRNLGLIAARNRGLQECSAPLMAILDSDDIALPHRLATQWRCFEADPALALLGSCAELIDAQGRVFGASDVPGPDDAQVRRQLLVDNPVIQSSVMLRTAAARAVGGYPADLSIAEDYALWLALADRYRIGNLRERLVQYRVHGGQVSQSRMRQMRELAGVLQARYWAKWQAEGRTADVLPPRHYKRRGHWRGRAGTLGGDYLYWARLYLALGDERAARRTARAGLRAAPLCWELMSIAWRGADSGLGAAGV